MLLYYYTYRFYILHKRIVIVIYTYNVYKSHHATDIDLDFIWRTPNKLKTLIYLFISSILPLISESLLTVIRWALRSAKQGLGTDFAIERFPHLEISSFFGKNSIRSIFDVCLERYTDIIIHRKETTIIIKNLILYIENVNNEIYGNIHDYYVLIVHNISEIKLPLHYFIIL